MRLPFFKESSQRDIAGCAVQNNKSRAHSPKEMKGTSEPTSKNSDARKISNGNTSKRDGTSSVSGVEKHDKSSKSTVASSFGGSATFDSGFSGNTTDTSARLSTTLIPTQLSHGSRQSHGIPEHASSSTPSTSEGNSTMSRTAVGQATFAGSEREDAGATTNKSFNDVSRISRSKNVDGLGNPQPILPPPSKSEGSARIKSHAHGEKETRDRDTNSTEASGRKHSVGAEAYPSQASSSSTQIHQHQLVAQPRLSPTIDDTYSFFAKYTYSSECALLGYNFHTIISQLGIFEFVSYPHDYRLISVTLAYIFFKYRIHHCDMALDLALTLIYLEELSAPTLLSFENNDAFNLVCYFAFLAHVYNADRTIRLTDWYKEMNRVGAPNAFENCKAANKYVWFLLNDVRGLRLMPNEQRVKKYIQRLCAAPQPQTVLHHQPHPKPKSPPEKSKK